MNKETTPEERLQIFRSWVSEQKRTFGEAYTKLHEMFDESKPSEKEEFMSVASGDEIYLYDH